VITQEADDIQKQVKQIDAKIVKAKNKLIDLRIQRANILSHTRIECTKNNYGVGCGVSHQIKDLDYISYRFYVAPSGCTDGDYWLTSKDDAYFYCPTCGHKNRMYDRKQYMELKDQFKSSDQVEER
jgi:hypothetical protein